MQDVPTRKLRHLEASKLMFEAIPKPLLFILLLLFLLGGAVTVAVAKRVRTGLWPAPDDPDEPKNLADLAKKNRERRERR
jgi:hypothetical protein